MNNNWISTRDLMPVLGEEVLVVAISKYRHSVGLQYVRMAEYTEVEGWHLYGWPAGMEFAVTHWMPLPELPPEEESAADYKQLYKETAAELFALQTELARSSGEIEYLKCCLEECKDWEDD